MVTMERGEIEIAKQSRPTGGIYSVPVVGGFAGDVREFFDQMAPQQSDSTQVKVAKEVLRWTVVGAAGVSAAALTAVVVL
ncbi:hypothetical protein M6B22_13440 [Jatrophihabitans cynanchi]|uniref:Uncharacterized protein n=1 Tax=Jatrophihabitans cynanchi TaxID=2944128 RepID=A0ABY7JWI9_9ACTN|nr:hypothetical protein [Jatrophihabitans sp. SB3-54]WAX55544.1 hypothetical protein M6B22_13440 [Jatrophihabitans sp. SB3-54]